MRTHIIPKQYQHGFIDTQSKIWTYNKGVSEPICYTTPLNTAVESDFYPREIERTLANQVEAPAAAVIKKIRQRKSITPADKNVLTRYVINFMVRVPHGKVRLKTVLPNVFNKVFSEDNLRNLMQGRRPTAKQLEEFWSLRQKWENKEEKVDEWWSSMLGPDRFNVSFLVLRVMTWQFLTFDSEPAFVTSDNPVFTFPHLGLSDPLSEMTFPISQNVALWATWVNGITQDYAPISKEIVKEVNRRTVCKATRSIFSPVKEQWVTELANQKYYRRCRIVTIDGHQHALQPF